MNTNIPTVFNFNTSEVRTVIINDEPWFIASDVCAVLGMKNPREAIRHLDDDEKGVISNDTLGGIQQMSVINESGLYALVLRSRKPEAKPFIKWVTREVLPSIRKTGGYQIPGTKKALPGKLTAASQDLIKKAVRDRVESLPREKWQGASMALWGAIGVKFGVRGVKDGYKNIPEDALSEIMSLVARTPLSGEYIPANAAVDAENEAKINVQELMLGGYSTPTVKLPEEVQRAVDQQAFSMAHECFTLSQTYLTRKVAYHAEIGQPRRIDSVKALLVVADSSLADALTHTFKVQLDRLVGFADMLVISANGFRKDVHSAKLAISA